jgi:hypothetical protein
VTETSDPRIRWLLFLLLVSVVLVLFAGSLLWDQYLGKDFMEENAGGLGRIGYIPIELNLSAPQNITIFRVDWNKYLEKPDNYDIDLLIVGDSFSNAGSLPEYLASQNNISVLALRTLEVEPVRKYSPINLLIALDNAGIIDRIHPDCILLESVPRLTYQDTKSVDFSSNITTEELQRAISLFYKQIAMARQNTTANTRLNATVNTRPNMTVNTRPNVTANARLNTSVNRTADGNPMVSLQKPENIVTDIQAVLGGLVSPNAQNWQDPVQADFDNMTRRMINLRQMMVSLLWLQFTGHTAPIPGQPSMTYRFQLDKPLFSSARDADSLFVISGDLMYPNYMDDRGWVYQYNIYLNTLEDRFARKNITFYFMPAIDKFDFYYPRITSNPYPVNPFYSTLDAQYKAYYYINPKQILNERLANDTRDIFWLGDTHWSWMSVEYFTSRIAPFKPQQPKPFSLNESIAGLPPDPEIRNSVAEALLTAGEYGYGSQMTQKLAEIETGRPVSAIRLADSAGNLSYHRIYGRIDSVILHNESVELTGWAIDPVTVGPARFVLITDKDKNIVAVSMITKKRPDIAIYFANEKLLVSGWMTIINKDALRPGSFPLRAYVVSPRQNIAYPLTVREDAQALMMQYRQNLTGNN